MSDSDCETEALLQPDTPPKHPEYLSESDETSTTDDESDETTTTDDECGEIFEDCVSDFLKYDQQKVAEDHFSKKITHDRPQCSSSASDLKWDEVQDAFRFFAGDVQRSSDDSNKKVTDDQPQSSPDAPSLKLDKCHDALRYFAGDCQSSSGDSTKVSSAASSVDLNLVVEYTNDEFGNPDYVDIDFDDSIGEKHIEKLMNKLRLNHYTSISCEGDFTLSKCKKLFERDYFCEIIENSGGSLCRNYPARLIIPVAEKITIASSERLNAIEFNPKKYSERIKQSVSSRLLTRFVAPVILCDKKFICRSGSLTVRKTAVFETARQREQPKSVQISACILQQVSRCLSSSLADLTNRGRKAASQLFVPSSIEKLRDVDAEIIRILNIQHICDLMIEDRKKFKQTISLSSSEKINRTIYGDSAIEQMPYPGCKLFRKYQEANHNPEGLVFDWTRRDATTEMQFSDDPYANFPDINWTNYKEWDLVDLTKNYLKILLSYLVKDPGGLLVHCISGWDRTPLFISMLRVSLWADGVIHRSLDYRDMAYLTLAYDWYLFGHDFPNRLRKKQEIMHFCFKFLEYISTDEFSVTRIFHELPLEQRRDRKFTEYEPGRRDILNVLSAYVLKTYDKRITRKL